ncbi:MAG TPA: PKD-like domain-containing protein, partial [Flavobacterium sp.]|uniref:PKD-like domain-containing protein n=1 Tax=Flavobacterium sp. TaxID=239 RepID=UPI002B51E436
MKKIFTLLFIASYVLNLNAKELNTKYLRKNNYESTKEWSIKTNDFSALAPAITLTSSPSTANQAICVNNPIVNITYATSGGATGATVTGLPAGVTGTYAANIFTISGTPTVTGVFNYSITTVGGSPAATTTGTITISDRPNITVNIPSICQGGTTVVTATPGTSGSYSYAWTTPSGAPNPGNVASFSTSVLGTYSVIVTNMATNCSSASASGTVTSTPTPTVTASPASSILCSGQSTGILLTGTTPNTTFSWTYSQTGNVTGAANGSGNIISQVLTTGSTPGTVTYTITPSANGCTGTPINVTVTVNPIPVVNVNITQASICTGDTTNITLSSNTPGTTYSWNVVQSGGVIGASASPNTNATSINQVLTTSSTTIGHAIYTITPITNACPGSPVTVTVTVYPRPNITASPSSSTICSGETTNIIMSSNVPGTVFNWTVVPTGVLGAMSGTGNQINQTLTTIGLSQGVVTYYITPTVGGCTGTPITVTITVNPTPEVFSLTGTSLILCSGESVGILINSNIPGTTFTWTVVQNGVDGAFGGNG